VEADVDSFPESVRVCDARARIESLCIRVSACAFAVEPRDRSDRSSLESEFRPIAEMARHFDRRYTGVKRPCEAKLKPSRENFRRLTRRKEFLSKLSRASHAKHSSVKIDRSSRSIRSIHLFGQLGETVLSRRELFFKSVHLIDSYVRRTMDVIRINNHVGSTSPMHVSVDRTCARCIWHVQPFFSHSIALDYSRI